jgi:hypothetical protein
MRPAFASLPATAGRYSHPETAEEAGGEPGGRPANSSGRGAPIWKSQADAGGQPIQATERSILPLMMISVMTAHDDLLDRQSRVPDVPTRDSRAAQDFITMMA